MIPASSHGLSGGLGPPSGALAVRAYRRGRAEVLVVAGEVDHATIAEFRKEIGRRLQGSPPVLVLDLDEVTFLGSVGLSALVEAEGRAAPNTALRIVATNRAVRRPIELTALDRVLAIFPTADEAASG